MIALNFELVKEIPDAYNFEGSPGINVLNNALLATVSIEEGFFGKYDFYRSADGGATWNKISSLSHNGPQIGARVVNLPGNVLITATTDISNNTLKIYRSTNGGDTWNIAQEYPTASNPDSLIAYFTCRGIKRHGAIVAGFLNRAQGGGYNSQLTFSEDFGETWDDTDAIVLSTMDDGIDQLANGGDGAMLAANETGWVHKTADYGKTWEATEAPEVPSGEVHLYARSVTYIDKNRALAGGAITSETDPYWPVLYYSDDGGATWTHVPASDIENWPNSGFALVVHELTRLTKDGAILGVEDTFKRNMAPWRYSIDRGATWKEPTQTGGHPSTDFNMVRGAIAIDEQGNIWSVVDQTTGFVSTAQIWKGTLTC